MGRDDSIKTSKFVIAEGNVVVTYDAVIFGVLKNSVFAVSDMYLTPSLNR
jgi:hypothetical protein